MNRVLTYPLITSILGAFGVDSIQYKLLLNHFKTLSDRQEFEMGSSSASRNIVVGLFATIVGIGNLVAAFGVHPVLHTFVEVNFLIAGLLLLMTLLPEAVNTFLNPIEVSVLAHQPIHDATYFAAKMTYLAAAVAMIVFPLSIVPSLAGLNLTEARWFYPVTYLAAVYIYGIFIALVLCSVLGVLFRIVPAARLRSIALKIQAAALFVIVLVPGTARFLARFVPGSLAPANPVIWFVALATVGQGTHPVRWNWTAAVTVVLAGGLVAYGISSLCEGYLTRVHTLLRSGPSGKRSSHQFLGSLARTLTGKPSGRAAFHFMYSMARSDWQFQRTVIPLLIQLLIFVSIGIVRGLGVSPFKPGSPTFAHFLPHMSGLAGLALCMMLTYSNQHRAAWIFVVAPLESIQSFVRGIFWALWIPFSALPILMFPVCAWYWGMSDAFLFTVYSLALGSVYLSVELFLLDGLPFANPPRAGSGAFVAPLVAAAFIGAALLVGLQWLFIFRNELTTLGASLTFALGAYFICRASLRHVEINVFHNLHIIASGRAAMFKEVS